MEINIVKIMAISDPGQGGIALFDCLVHPFGADPFRAGLYYRHLESLYRAGVPLFFRVMDEGGYREFPFVPDDASTGNEL